MTQVLGIDVSDLIVTLSNGKRVANFSSPHAFTFEDGSVLPAVADWYAEKYKVEFYEATGDNGDVHLSFGLSDNTIKLANMWMKVWEGGLVDVVFCPLPMIHALDDHSGVCSQVKDSPFRSIRIVDRISKLASISKQCL